MGSRFDNVDGGSLGSWRDFRMTLAEESGAVGFLELCGTAVAEVGGAEDGAVPQCWSLGRDLMKVSLLGSAMLDRGGSELRDVEGILSLSTTAEEVWWASSYFFLHSGRGQILTDLPAQPQV